jgi:hypothetical protein
VKRKTINQGNYSGPFYKIRNFKFKKF